MRRETLVKTAAKSEFFLPFPWGGGGGKIPKTCILSSLSLRASRLNTALSLPLQAQTTILRPPMAGLVACLDLAV